MKNLLVLLALLCAGRANAAPSVVLNVYGPGGPAAPMKECATLFSKAHGVQVEVTAGPEAKWSAKAGQDADIIYGGAEYMLSQFVQKNPGLVDVTTRTELYPRAAGILVRKGNPKRIRSLADLARPGVRLVDVTGAGQLGLWEDLAGRHGLIPGIQNNILITVPSSADAIEKWKSLPQLDAWISYESWHLRLKDTTDLVRLPLRDRLYRGTPIAITKISKNRAQVAAFVAYLKSPAGHRVFQKWGWK